MYREMDEKQTKTRKHHNLRSDGAQTELKCRKTV